MGAKQGKPVQSSKAGYYPDVEVVQAKHIDPHYGEVRYVRDKRTNQLLVLKEIYVNSKQGFEGEADFLHHRVALKHPNVVEIVGFNTVDQTSFCASSYKISVYVEVQEKTLQAQLNDRIFNRQAYSEGEILHIAESLVSALSYFQNKGHAHGDIRPANIFVKANTVKLSDPSLSAHRGTNGITLVVLHGQKAFLAPELLGNIIKKAFDFKTDKHKADVFSLGVTLLSLATLTNCEDLYNYKLGSLNEGLLGERLAQVRARYNTKLYDLIRSMLTLDEKVRPDFVTLAKALNVYNASPVLVQQAPVQYQQRIIPQQAVLNTVRVNAGDDLDQRIRAALDRSNQSYTLASPTKTSNVTTTLNTPITQTVQAPVNTEYLRRSFAPVLTNYVSGYNTQPTYTTVNAGYTGYTGGYTVLPNQTVNTTTTNTTTTEAAKKSSVPTETKTETKNEKKAEPESYLSNTTTGATTTTTTNAPTYTSRVIPSNYGYTTGAYTTGAYTTGNYTTLSGSEVLKRSYSNLNTYVPSTTTGATYTTVGAPQTYTTGNYTTVGGSEVLKRSYAPLTTGSYTVSSPTIRHVQGESIVRSSLPSNYGYTTGGYTTQGYTTGLSGYTTGNYGGYTTVGATTGNTTTGANTTTATTNNNTAGGYLAGKTEEAGKSVTEKIASVANNVTGGIFA